MKTYVLNIYNAYERRLSTVTELRKQNITHELFYAINNNQFGLKSDIRHLSPGAVGAFISHYSVLLNATRVQDNMFLFFEDDVKLEDDFLAHLQTSIEQLPPDWDIAFVGWFLQNNGFTEAESGNECWFQVKGALGMYAYLVKGSSVHKVLGELYTIRDHVDKQIALSIERRRLNGYWLRNQLVGCKEFASQIPK
jgi:GR25 family glycosyltransferase involved in LPS biosynthesis